MRVAPLLIVVSGLLLAGGGVATYAAEGDDPSSRYRLSTAGVGDVEQTLTTSGTVDAAGRADVATPVDGTVARVRVRTGQKVRSGQVLATLERTELKAAVTQAEAALAVAQAQLETDKDAQDDLVDDAATSTPSEPTSQPAGQPTGQPSSPPAGPDASAVTAAIKAALAALHAQQEAVASAQTTVSTALADARTALEAQTKACATVYDPTDSPTDTGSADSRGSSDPTLGPDVDVDDDPDQACSEALANVQAKQQDAADAEDALAAALTELTRILASALEDIEAAARPTADRGTGSPSGAPSTSSPGGDPTAQATSQTTGSDDDADDTPDDTAEISAARLAADQAAIDQAEADLVEARATLAQARIVAPIGGRVAAVDVSRGDPVSAGDVVATIVSGSGVVIETTVPESRIRQVHVGQKVRVTPSGASSRASGVVSAIGLTADSSSGTPSYGVTVAVADPDESLPAGSRATLEVVTASSKGVVTVPVSAVSSAVSIESGSDGTDTVRVLENGEITAKKVTLGIVGKTHVEVTDGLVTGDAVVLADLDQEVTGAGTDLGGRVTFGGPNGFEGPSFRGPESATMGP